MEKKKKAEAYLANGDIIREYIQSNYSGDDGFFMLNYRELLDRVRGDFALAFRFLYLCSYLGYKNILKQNQKSALTSDWLKSLLGLNDRSIEDLIKELEAKKMLMVAEDHTMAIDKKIAWRGKIDSEAEGDCGRIFSAGIRGLYKSLLPREHKAAGAMLSLFPYVNIRNNALCWDAQTEPIESLPLSVKQISVIMGYDPTNATRTLKKLSEFKIRGVPLIKKLPVNGADYYVVSPLLFLKSIDLDYMQWLTDKYDVWNRMTD